MSALDNRELIAPFIPEVFDGDTFFYTEILDRRKRSGNNRGRRLHEFIHRDRATFVEQGEQIVAMCEFFQARAYTRLSARSFRLVGMAYVKTIVEQALTDNWQGMRHAYAKALGTTPGKTKVWLFDIDNANQAEEIDWLIPRDAFLAKIPSRKGLHVMSRPFNLTGPAPDGGAFPSIADRLRDAGIELHKDNPTNLYIPNGAA